MRSILYDDKGMLCGCVLHRSRRVPWLAYASHQPEVGPIDPLLGGDYVHEGSDKIDWRTKGDAFEGIKISTV